MPKKPATDVVDIGSVNQVRVAHNYLNRIKKGAYQVDEINVLNSYVQELLNEAKEPKKSYKVGLMFVCINQPYWQYLRPVIEGVRNYWLPGHETEIMIWNDMHQFPEARDVNYGCTIFPVESIEWPYPTLMRYNYFLQQEEYLKKFDYLFYLDLDMRVVGIVGDEILGETLTMAQHPMYATPQNLWYPYEPNPQSKAHIKQPGRIVKNNGKPYFQPLYAAGGLQGGKTGLFIDAMKTMQKWIDDDMGKGYIARWNDESHWNKFLYERGMDDLVVLDPSYVYPDSMIEGYYVPKVWGRNYTPRIITLTKPFSTSKEGGEAARQLMMQP